MEYRYPFGEKVNRLTQIDRTSKDVFVLGVYASAVHARWVKDNKIMCQALAVASEPYIFWDGNQEQALEIITKIRLPKELGKLILPNKNLNGPSAKVLEDNILKPLGYDRKQAWLCDLLPESRLNPNQIKVIENVYNPLIQQYGLNEVTVPIKDGKFCDERRREEITDEIIESNASKLILLGDIPIKQYLKYVVDIDFNSLREFTERYGYGKPYIINFRGRPIEVMPIAHPRQIGVLGRSNTYWYEEHKKWEENKNI